MASRVGLVDRSKQMVTCCNIPHRTRPPDEDCMRHGLPSSLLLDHPALLVLLLGLRMRVLLVVLLYHVLTPG